MSDYNQDNEHAFARRYRLLIQVFGHFEWQKSGKYSLNLYSTKLAAFHQLTSAFLNSIKIIQLATH